MINKQLASTIGWLYGLQLADYILPAITVPYLARTLQPERWGSVLYMQAYSMWLALFVEYGFTLSTTRELARMSGESADHDAIGEVISGTSAAQVILALLSLAVTITARMFLTDLYRESSLLWCAWGIAVFHGLRPMWFYQAIGQQHIPAIVSVLTRVVTTVGTLSIVDDPEDAAAVLYLQGAGGAVVMVSLYIYMYSRVGFQAPNWCRTLRAFRTGWSSFLFRGATSLYTNLNTILLGWFVSPVEVAFFGGPERLTKIVLSILGPINQAVYPFISRMISEDRPRAVKVVRSAVFLFALLGTLSCGAVLLAAPYIVNGVLGPGYGPAVVVLRILSLQMPFVAVSGVLGIYWMLPLGLDNALNRVIGAAAVVNLSLAPVLASSYGPIGMALANVMCEVCVLCGQVYCVWYYSRDEKESVK